MALLTIVSSSLLSFSLLCFNPLFIYFSDPDRLGDLPTTFVWKCLGLSALATILLSLPSRWAGRRYALGLSFVCIVAFVYSYVAQIDFGLFRGNRFGDEGRIFATAKVAYFVEPIALLALFFLLRLSFRLRPTVMTVFLGRSCCWGAGP